MEKTYDFSFVVEGKDILLKELAESTNHEYENMNELELDVMGYNDPIDSAPGGHPVFKAPISKVLKNSVKEFNNVEHNLIGAFTDRGESAITYLAEGNREYDYSFKFIDCAADFKNESLELRGFIVKDEQTKTGMVLEGKLSDKNLKVLFDVMSGSFFDGCTFTPQGHDSEEVLGKFNNHIQNQDKPNSSIGISNSGLKPKTSKDNVKNNDLGDDSR